MSETTAREISLQELQAIDQEKSVKIDRKLSKEDKPHQRLTIENMTNEQFNEHIFSCRTRRMTAANAYLVAEESKRLATIEKVKEKIEQQSRLMNAELERHEKLIEKMEKRAAGIFAMRDELNQLELGE